MAFLIGAIIGINLGWICTALIIQIWHDYHPEDPAD